MYCIITATLKKKCFNAPANNFGTTNGNNTNHHMKYCIVYTLLNATNIHVIKYEQNIMSFLQYLIAIANKQINCGKKLINERANDFGKSNDKLK